MAHTGNVTRFSVTRKVNSAKSAFKRAPGARRKGAALLYSVRRVFFAGGQTAETRIARILLSLAAITFDTRHAGVIALGQAERREG